MTNSSQAEIDILEIIKYDDPPNKVSSYFSQGKQIEMVLDQAVEYHYYLKVALIQPMPPQEVDTTAMRGCEQAQFVHSGCILGIDKIIHNKKF